MQKCVACKQEIPNGASLCHECKSYQSSWKNTLQYFAGIATLLALFVSLAVWLYGKARIAFFYRDDVRVISCNTLNAAVIQNRGDGEVFVSRLLLWMPGRSTDWAAPNLQIDETLQPGKFVKKAYEPSKMKTTGTFIRGVSADDFQKLIHRALIGDPCYEVVLFSAEDSWLSDLKIMAGPTLNTFDVAGRLEYRGQKSDSAQYVYITGLGLVQRDTRPECSGH